MRSAFDFWFLDRSPVSRRSYLQHGLGLAALKVVVEGLAVALTTGQLWRPWLYAWPGQLAPDVIPTGLALGLLLWSVPFVWLGVTLSARRARDAGRSPWWSLLLLLPFAGYLLIAVLCLLPTRDDAQARDGDGRRAALPAAVAAGAAVALPLLLLAFRVESFGAGLFLGAPFAFGVALGAVLNLQQRSTATQTVSASLIGLAGFGLVLILMALEGVVCILMALPLGAVLTVLGALFGRALVTGAERAGVPGVTALLLAVPTGIVLEPPPAPELREVRSSVFVAAEPLDVWDAVVAFPPLAEPDEWWFKAGVAYPTHAEILGEGVGAVRYCVFSTGAFVEPITAWEPGRRLAFDVSESPAPLRELSWRDIHPPHLDGYLRSVRGEFRLISRNGGTLLEGSTWYEQSLGPESYWAFFSDRIIGNIHERVLQHVREVAEERAR